MDCGKEVKGKGKKTTVAGPCIVKLASPIVPNGLDGRPTIFVSIFQGEFRFGVFAVSPRQALRVGKFNEGHCIRTNKVALSLASLESPSIQFRRGRKTARGK